MLRGQPSSRRTLSEPAIWADGRYSFKKKVDHARNDWREGTSQSLEMEAEARRQLTHLPVPHKVRVRAISEIDPDTEPASRLLSLERDERDRAHSRCREGEQELGLDPRSTGSPDVSSESRQPESSSSSYLQI